MAAWSWGQRDACRVLHACAHFPCAVAADGLPAVAYPVAFAIEQQDVAAVRETVDQGDGHGLVAECRRALGEGQFRGDGRDATVIAVGEELEG